MGAVKNQLIEMQEASPDMSYSKFCKTYSESDLFYWFQVRYYVGEPVSVSLWQKILVQFHRTMSHWSARKYRRVNGEGSKFLKVWKQKLPTMKDFAYQIYSEDRYG
tara:strand:- start:221 stop:538 length:318 start_codon:yes stop_codon:yes gene_type:complete